MNEDAWLEAAYEDRFQCEDEPEFSDYVDTDEDYEEPRS